MAAFTIDVSYFIRNQSSSDNFSNLVLKTFFKWLILRRLKNIKRGNNTER